MDIKDFVQSDSLYHPHADAWLVLGRDAKGRFATGWIARQKPEKIISCRRFLDEASAQAAFVETAESDDIPAALITAPDWKNRPSMTGRMKPLPVSARSSKIRRKRANCCGRSRRITTSTARA